MIKKFNIGCNFDIALIEGVKKLNKKYNYLNNSVTEFYGSLRYNKYKLPTARPDFRLPDISKEEAKSFIQECHKAGISFNYTLNSPLTGRWFFTSQLEWNRIIEFLHDLNVDIVTISHPLALSKIMSFNPNFKIEISTILDINNLNAIKYYCDNFKIEKICLSITKNRDFRFLRNINKAGYSDRIELLVNEFCNVAGIPCQNFYRKACYDLHSFGGNPDNQYEGFPLLWCSDSRYKNPVSWIKANVIYPHDIRAYYLSGFSRFKITGRTLPTQFILYVAEAYLSQGAVMNDNLLSLWGHVDKISSNKKLTDIPEGINISLRELRKRNFLSFFIDKKISCSDILCSDCKLCERFYELAKIK